MGDREEVRFDSGGLRCAGWLYKPSGSPPHPLVVLGHGLTAVREMRLDAYAERFRASGLAALAFDYRSFGASEGEPRGIVDVERQLEDWAAAIAYTRSLTGVDPRRIALWGTSLGGGHAPVAGTRDGQVAAVVSQCPFSDGHAQARHAPALTLAIALAGFGDRLGRAAGLGPLRLPLTGRARAEVERIVPATSTWKPQLSASTGLQLPRYRPFLEAQGLRCPWLVCVCERDRVAPARAAVEWASRSPVAEVISYPIDHYDIYLGDWFERASDDQASFLRRHLLHGA